VRCGDGIGGTELTKQVQSIGNLSTFFSLFKVVPVPFLLTTRRAILASGRATATLQLQVLQEESYFSSKNSYSLCPEVVGSQ
jgi:hypothetical protein